MNRRQVIAALAGVVATAVTGAAVARRSTRSRDGQRTVRVGVMSNLTHAPLLAGLGSGRIQAELTPLGVRLETRVFRAGPRVTEALIGDAIDIGTAGPAPVVIHHARHRGGGGLRITGGVCSGGASLVVTERSNIQKVSDLRGKRVAVTQLGTTQDIALRSSIRDAGLREAASGGDVTVLAIANATILDQMRHGDLDAAWLPEPWATRVVSEVRATRLLDERDLWPGRRFATAVVATTGATADAKPAWLDRFTRALGGEVERLITADAEGRRETLREAHEELKRHVGNPGSFAIFEKAAAFVDFTPDPIRASVERFGEAATSFGFCPAHATEGLFIS